MGFKRRPTAVKAVKALRLALLDVDKKDRRYMLREVTSAVGTLVYESRDERQAQLLALLKEHNGNVSAVGRAMGKERIQIRRWCKAFDINIEDFR